MCPVSKKALVALFSIGMMTGHLCAAQDSTQAADREKSLPQLNSKILTPVRLGFELKELDLDPSDPERFHCRFTLEFRWKPSDYPSLNPAKFSFLNCQNPTLLLRVKASDKAEAEANGDKVSQFLIDGNFKGYNDFARYPFDAHEFPVIVVFPEVPWEKQNFTSSSQDLTVRLLHSSRIAGWWLDKICFYPDDKGFLHSLPVDANDNQIPIVVFTIEAHREWVNVLVRIIIPMFLLWVMSYCGFAWADANPTCGTAAIVAAVAFSLGTNALHPKVEYISSLHAGFLGLYSNIVLCFVFSSLVYVTKRFQKKKLSKRIWIAGLISCPCMLLLSVILALSIGINKADFDSMFDHHAAIYHDFSGDKLNSVKK